MFKGPDYLIEHCEQAHNMQICKKYSKYGECIPVTSNCQNNAGLELDGVTARNNFVSPATIQQRKQSLQNVKKNQVMDVSKVQGLSNHSHQQVHQFNVTNLSNYKKAKTKHDQIYSSNQNSSQITNLNLGGVNNNNKFKNIKTIHLNGQNSSNGKFINNISKVKNQQFIGMH